MRESPERVPAQNALVAMTLAAKLLLILVVTQFLDVEKTALQLTTEIMVGAAVTTLLVALFLELRSLSNRLAPTVAALFGSDLILTSLFALALIPLTNLSLRADLVGQLFSLWSAAIAGFIMHKAMDTSFLIGFGVGMFILLISISVAAQI